MIRVDSPATPTVVEPEDADCLVTDDVGTLVYVSGDSIGDRLQVTAVDVTDDTKVPAIGSIVEKPTATTCRVRRFGRAAGADLVSGKVCFAGVDARPTVTPPTPGLGSFVWVQPVGVAIDSTTVLLAPTLQLTKRRG